MAGADAEQRVAGCLTTLHSVIQQEHDAAVGALLSFKANPEACSDSSFQPLHHAAYHNLPDAVERLLKNRGVYVDAPTRDGSTPLKLAAAQGHTEVVRVLLGAGASTEYMDSLRHTPLFAAMVPEFHSECVELLVTAGADYKTTVDCMDLLPGGSRLWAKEKEQLTGIVVKLMNADQLTRWHHLDADIDKENVLGWSSTENSSWVFEEREERNGTENKIVWAQRQISLGAATLQFYDEPEEKMLDASSDGSSSWSGSDSDRANTDTDTDESTLDYNMSDDESDLGLSDAPVSSDTESDIIAWNRFNIPYHTPEKARASSMPIESDIIITRDRFNTSYRTPEKDRVSSTAIKTELSFTGVKRASTFEHSWPLSYGIRASKRPRLDYQDLEHGKGSYNKDTTENDGHMDGGVELSRHQPTTFPTSRVITGRKSGRLGTRQV